MSLCDCHMGVCACCVYVCLSVYVCVVVTSSGTSQMCQALYRYCAVSSATDTVSKEMNVLFCVHSSSRLSPLPELLPELLISVDLIACLSEDHCPVMSPGTLQATLEVFVVVELHVQCMLLT